MSLQSSSSLIHYFIDHLIINDILCIRCSVIIKRVMSAGMVVVYNCDCGDITMLTTNDLRPLAEQFLLLPQMAIPAKLYGSHDFPLLCSHFLLRKYFPVNNVHFIMLLQAFDQKTRTGVPTIVVDFRY